MVRLRARALARGGRQWQAEARARLHEGEGGGKLTRAHSCTWGKMIIRLRARAHLNAEKTSFQSQRAFNVKELPTSKSYRRQIASNVKELPMSKSFRRQKASDAKELCNNKFRRWLGGVGVWNVVMLCLTVTLPRRCVGLGRISLATYFFHLPLPSCLVNKFRRWLGGGGCGHALSHRYIAAAFC